jgi:hypothetical protein
MRLSWVVAVAFALAVVNCAPSAAQVMLGVHVGPPNDPNWRSELTALETQIGRTLAIDSDYDYWAALPDTPRIRWDVQTGHLPMQSWRVEFSAVEPITCATAAAIDAGVYDTQLMRQARAVKVAGSVVLVRFNFEMTDNEENTCFTGFPVEDNLPLAAQEFITAWRHVVDRFRAAGATNVQWVWAPGRGAYENGIASMFYPGPAYVDWIAIDMYNKTLKPIPFNSSGGVNQFYAWASTQGKPLMISENGAYDDPGQDPSPQSEWISTARTFIKARPAIKAYVYWGALPPTPPPPPTYQLQGLGLEAFKALANDPYFGGQ